MRYLRTVGAVVAVGAAAIMTITAGGRVTAQGRSCDRQCLIDMRSQYLEG